MNEKQKPDGQPQAGTSATHNSAVPPQPGKTSFQPSDTKAAATTPSEASKSATGAAAVGAPTSNYTEKTATSEINTSAKSGSTTSSDDQSFTDKVKDTAETATDNVKEAAGKAADKIEDLGKSISSGGNGGSGSGSNQPGSHFGNGMFVIALIVLALVILALTWSVSFSAMLFGAIGAMLSVALCIFVNHDSLNFEAQCNAKPSEENLVYLAVRAVVGMISGAAVCAIVFVSIVPNWHLVAVVALFAGLIFDRLLFPRIRSQK